MKRATTAPQLEVNEARRTLTWVDAVILVSLLALLWSAMHFGKGMLVHFDAAAQPRLDLSASQIPY
jgi:NitT/TauT family transport system permease protein